MRWVGGAGVGCRGRLGRNDGARMDGSRRRRRDVCVVNAMGAEDDDRGFRRLRNRRSLDHCRWDRRRIGCRRSRIVGAVGRGKVADERNCDGRWGDDGRSMWKGERIVRWWIRLGRGRGWRWRFSF